MEDQAMSSARSSSPKPEKLKGILVPVEESEEKATKKIHLKLGSPQEVSSESRIENSSTFGYGAVRREGEIMKLYPSKSNKVHICNYCKREFSSYEALGGHQNAHKQEREWDKKRKAMEANLPGPAFLRPFLDKPHILLGGYSEDALSNENHLGVNLDHFKHIVDPSFNNGVIGGITDMNMTIVPRVTPTRFFTGNTSTNGSTSWVPGLLPSYNNMYPLIPREKPVFPLQTTTISSDFSSHEKDFISKIGITNVVEIDEDDDVHPEEGKSERGGVNLSLSL